MRKKVYAIVFMACLTLLLGTGCSGKPSAETEVTGPETQQPAPPAENSCTAVIEIEGYGTITLELDASAAPVTTENFVSLAREGFYDGLTFHRIIEGFMIQGGDPDGNGTGGSEQTIKGEFRENGVENSLSHTRGVISMARSNDYDSASSQFFIVHEDSTFLDGDYAAFGYVTSGIEIVDDICENTTGQDANGVVPMENRPVIEKIEYLGE